MRKRIEEAVKAAGIEMPFSVERPARMAHGDYSTNAALIAKTDARKLADKLKVEGVERIEAAGKFINFFLSREAILKKIQDTQIEPFHTGKKIMVEYTDPNPFKEFHIGHLMSNAIGEAIARLLERSGARVIRANYQGDVGPHVAKAIWGKLQKPDLGWGEAYAYGAREYEVHKDEIDELNKKIYKISPPAEVGDPQISALYDAGRKESLEHFEEIYKKLGTKFDYYFFESETGRRGLEIVKRHPEIFEESEGAVVFRGEHTRVFVTKWGLPTYEAKDLGLAEMKKEKAKFDQSITVTANEQDAYFRVVLEALERVHPEWKGQFRHVSHGMMRFAEGKMSSRKGNVITGESLLEELKERARGRMDVAVGAIKYAVLRQGSGRDIIFDPEKSLSLEGDSGPYLQYARVRAASLLREAAKHGIAAFGTEAEDRWRSRPLGQVQPTPIGPLERLLVHYPDALARAAREMEPHYLTTYLTELAGVFNSWYARERVIGGENPQMGVFLATAAERALHEGLDALGIPVPEEM
ncbi:arginine--tRNA ligase [Candidatus Adlerbacteria bacterium RIFCSPHIGHO2_01_FULL_54_23]|uniref:Arginine--tRNA ligase n=3 Tax=Candidatus Adleribacteriota TaxID=1752736 RepID=A0A1F4XZZ2_9BACT|nr:MAG: Arginine-tRNA ligase [Candidatus Adlerbacteria bacterium GW2011_GWA1_54_10]KKW37830.1 MAG: Arginine-tRNA ligase [Candidatus Adlerbacteria bacterium GW2011_GWB1_54_7]OGC78861.1 MAG: arginine--tRNA ligase [Candidatus Adlerbacteria bacterium RIFCSPHIGHO2_01_FULL_54_23]OGC87239.1 MAG: arginine--tRNA ligase [Candidatus Adlerbacteria bacterium RIFCSPLOWO2_01_FULL_54_16]